MINQPLNLACLTDLLVLTPLYGSLAGLSGGMAMGVSDAVFFGAIIGGVFALVPGWWIYASFVLGVREGTALHDAHPRMEWALLGSMLGAIAGGVPGGYEDKNPLLALLGGLMGLLIAVGIHLVVTKPKKRVTSPANDDR